jgi:hypothetical protein
MSRIDEIIASVEAGETVDLDRAMTLMALDMVRSGERHVEDHIERQRWADEQFAGGVGPDR